MEDTLPQGHEGPTRSPAPRASAAAMARAAAPPGGQDGAGAEGAPSLPGPSVFVSPRPGPPVSPSLTPSVCSAAGSCRHRYGVGGPGRARKHLFPTWGRWGGSPGSAARPPSFPHLPPPANRPQRPRDRFAKRSLSIFTRSPEKRLSSPPFTCYFPRVHLGARAERGTLTDPARPAASEPGLRGRGCGGTGAARGGRRGGRAGRERRAASPAACGGSMISSAASRGPAKSCYASLRCVAFSCHFFHNKRGSEAGSFFFFLERKKKKKKAKWIREEGGGGEAIAKEDASEVWLAFKYPICQCKGSVYVYKVQFASDRGTHPAMGGAGSAGPGRGRQRGAGRPQPAL